MTPAHAETTRRGVRIRVALDSDEVSRGDSLTGSVEVQVDEPLRRWVPELSVALNGGTTYGDRAEKAQQAILNRHRAETDEPREYRFSLQVPSSILLGPARVTLTAGRGVSTWAPLARLSVTILPERCLLEVVELIKALSDHWTGSWTTSADGRGIYARLLPGSRVQDRLSGITAELKQVGHHVLGRLTVTARQRKSWLGPDDLSDIEYEFQTPIDDHSRLKAGIANLLHPLIGAERQLPIPAHDAVDSEDLPVPVQ